MKKILVLIILSAFILVSGVIVSAHAVSCGDTIVADTTLTNDLLDCPGKGIIIGANDITLDCDGHTLDGTRAYKGWGITISGRSNVIIKNCKIMDFSAGIDIHYSGNHNIVNNDISSIVYTGIIIYQSSSNNLINNSLSNTNLAIGLNQGCYNVITHNTISTNSKGIQIQNNADYNEIHNNNFIGNPTQIKMYVGTGNDFTYNYWSDHTCTGDPSDGSQPYIFPGGQDNYPFEHQDGWIIPDSDGDGISDADDMCPETTVDELEKALGTNRWIWNGTAWITKPPKGEGPQKSFTMEDTQGCSCSQILDTMGGKMMGHRKFGCSISVMEDFIAGLPTLLVDTVLVYANDPNPTSSDIVLEDGVQYELEAMGTAFASDTIDFDAKYSLTNRISGDTWTDSFSGYESYGPILLDLFVNGGSVDWGAYNDVHTYYQTVTGTGAALELLIYDIYYPDNSGFITVNIYELP